jgi:lipopolysaccharide/colanic/teichoic acid biosynthesis glycosyltransferase
MWSIKKRIQLISKTSRNDFGILDDEHFKHDLRIERARADRNHSYFSLVLYELYKIRNKAEIKDFIYKLYTRIRKVDILGWFQKDVVGVILHGAKLEGAWQFAVDVEAEFFTKHTPPPFTVFSYPDHWIKISDFDEDETDDSKDDKLGSTSLRNILQYYYLNKHHSYINIDKKAPEIQTSLITNKMPIWKRALDISVSFLSLVLLFPVFLIVSLYIKSVSPGPVFFRQKRVGYKGKLFTFYKFRTMHVGNDQNFHKNHMKSVINSEKPIEKLDDKQDPRIIPGGSLIRKSCIDELPQFFNILRGDMSLVGPRPCIPYEAKEYIHWHHNRFDTVPGLTGLWQVSGKNDLSFSQMIRLDIRYSRNISFINDLKIVLLTIPTVLTLIFKGLKKVLYKNRLIALSKTKNRRLLQQWLYNFIFLDEKNIK